MIDLGDGGHMEVEDLARVVTMRLYFGDGDTLTCKTLPQNGTCGEDGDGGMRDTITWRDLTGGELLAGLLQHLDEHHQEEEDDRLTAAVDASTAESYREERAC